MSDRSIADAFTADDLALLAQLYPQFADKLAEAISVESRERARLRYESSLVEFFKRAWQEIDPAPLKFNWHHEVICLPGDVLITTIDGNRRIDELVETNWRGLVASYNHKNLTCEWKPLKYGMKSPGTTIICIHTRGGSVLRCTETHPVYTVGKGYVNAVDLAAGDVLSIVPPMWESVFAKERSDDGHSLLALFPERSRRATQALKGRKDVGVPILREAILSLSLSNAWRVLQQKVFWRSEKETRNGGVSDLWGGEGAASEALPAMLFSRPVIISAFVHQLRERRYSRAIANAKTYGYFLQSGVLRALYAWAEQSGVYRWGGRPAPIFARIPNDAPLYTGEREPLMFLVRPSWEARCPPYKSKHSTKCGVEFSGFVSSLPQRPEGFPTSSEREGGAIVSKITREIRIPSVVYNIAVEGNENYFANGILVHNCQHLEAVSAGEIRRLLINIPPGTTKTNLASVIYPAWVWAQSVRGPLSGPQAKFLSITYGDKLSTTIARLSRRLVMSQWYQSLWGDRVKIYPDQSGLENFGNEAGGFRIATSIGGATLGRRGDCVVIDDPHKVDEVESQIERENVIRAYDEALATRVTDPQTAAEIIIMQRLHESDLSGHVLDRFGDQFEHLCLPMRFDPTRACAADLRTQEGELLWPAQWPEEAVARTEIRLGPYAAAGQLQQIPTPREGGIIGRNDWMVYPETAPQPGEVQRQADGQLLVRLPELSYVVAALDTAASEKETADWNALAVFGIWHRRRNDIAGVAPWFAERWSGVRDPEKETQRIIDEDEQPRAILVEAWRRRCRLNDEQLDRSGKPSGLVQRVIETCRRRRVDLLIIENKTLGKAVYDEIRRQMRKEEFQILLFEPRQYGDKVARLHACVPLFTQKLVYAPGNLVERYNQVGNSYVSIEEFVWVQAVMDEISQVPRGRHDDLADAVAMCLLILRKNGFLAMTQEYISESLRSRLWQRRQRLVGEQYGVL